ncbi:MAG: DNA translocase FtsK, partial [Ruminococcaceae bacterium]|nr:DNA translocase FtsK [Oscillospiraceae bacterium]
VAGKSKQQRAEEIARQAAGFAQEVRSADEQPMAEYHFPSISLLIPRDPFVEEDIRTELKKNSERLVAVLKEYGVTADIVDICRGPAVTRYELCPAPGVKINRITSLTDDIALRLAATAIRIEAPIPGKSAVGVEIPNDTASIVRISELIDTPAFRDAKSPVTVTVGKDIDGNVILANLGDMPHLLVAGSTGTGKSVCINSMLISLIFKASPEDVRLIMVDPKKVELDVYNGIPHLLVPVVTDPKKAAGALQWAVGEMEKRYSMLLERGVRSIKNYNKRAEETGEFAKLPRIIIIIDELADLMSNSPKEVENAIATLAAKARAAGIHMVLATQRPSVDVITGTIKNNIPSRIAFKVTSQVDSRTILDEGGANGLIGRGDMLFKPIGAKPLRVQGSFVDDDEVEAVVSFIKSKTPANYDEEIAREIERRAAADDEGAPGDSDDSFLASDDDPLFMKAAEVVIEAGQASVSLLQRRLTVGYARAGRIVDQLEKAGVVGPYEGSKPRQVIMSRQQLIEMTMARNLPPVRTEAPPAQTSFMASDAFAAEQFPAEPFPAEEEETDLPPFDLDPPVMQTTSPAQRGSASLDEQMARAAQAAEQMRMEMHPDDTDVPLPPHIEQLQQSAVKITIMQPPKKNS